MRPRRKRKLTNYGEGHLHWIEESQIQKALMKSLREKGSQPGNEKQTSRSETPPREANSTPPKMPRLSVAVTNCAQSNQKEPLNLECSVSIENILEAKGGTGRGSKLKHETGSGPKSPSRVRVDMTKSVKLTPKSAAIRKKFLRSRMRIHSPQTSDQDSDSSNQGSGQHAAMMQPRNSDNATTSNAKETGTTKMNLRQSRRARTNLRFEPASEEASSSGQAQALKTRAQRKFASNAVTPYPCSRPANAKAQCSSGAGSADSVPVSPDKKLPETRDFINFLCYRNTPLEKRMKADLFS